METTVSKVWLADDHQMVIDGFQLLLSQRIDIDIIGASNNGTHLLQSLGKHRTDLLISDLKMPGMDGLLLMKTIKERFPDLKILVVSMNDELEIIYRLFQSEVEGYILKNSGKRELFLAIDDILNEKIHYESELLKRIFRRQKEEQSGNSKVSLSNREKEVLHLVMQEKTSKEIAEQLFISKQTVDSHRLNIYEKTNTKTLVGLIKWALNNVGDF